MNAVRWETVATSGTVHVEESDGGSPEARRARQLAAFEALYSFACSCPREVRLERGALECAKCGAAITRRGT